MVGYERCNDVMLVEGSALNYNINNSISCKIPMHPAGVYPIKFRNKAGAANPRGEGMWYNYESAVLDIQPPLGSNLGGQVVTISGFGFAGSEICEDEVNVTGVVDFDFGTEDQNLDPIIVDYCYRNYTSTYSNDTFFKLTCASENARLNATHNATQIYSQFVEFSNPNNKNEMCSNQFATFTHKFSNSFMGIAEFNECVRVDFNATQLSFSLPTNTSKIFMKPSCGELNFNSPSVSYFFDANCTSPLPSSYTTSYDLCYPADGALPGAPWFSPDFFGNNQTVDNGNYTGSLGPTVHASFQWNSTYNQPAHPTEALVKSVRLKTHAGEANPIFHHALVVTGSHLDWMQFDITWTDYYGAGDEKANVFFTLYRNNR